MENCFPFPFRTTNGSCLIVAKEFYGRGEKVEGVEVLVDGS
jgi:hypothetical protein